jgi:hypothetical protein
MDAPDMAEKSSEDEELDKAQRNRLATIFVKLAGEISELDRSFTQDIQDNYPVSAKTVRSYAIKAIECFRSALQSAFFDEGKIQLLLTPALEVLLIELSEINVGKRSSFFLPSPGDTNRVKLTIRALSAAALHVFIEEKLLSLDDGAALISDELFKASICRVHADTKERSPIPPSTVMDWRNSRESHSREFANLFGRFVFAFFRVAAVPNETETKREAVRTSLSYLIRLFNFA